MAAATGRRLRGVPYSRTVHAPQAPVLGQDGGARAAAQPAARRSGWLKTRILPPRT